MTPNQAAQSLAGCSLARVAKESGVPVTTLERWHKNKLWVFDAVCEKVATKKSPN